MTVCGEFQFVEVKVRFVGLTVPSPRSVLESATDTLAEGRLASCAVKVAAPPASVAGPSGAETTKAASSSRMTTCCDGKEQPATFRTAMSIRSVRVSKSLLSCAVIVKVEVVRVAPPGTPSSQPPPGWAVPLPVTVKCVPRVAPEKLNCACTTARSGASAVTVTAAVPPFSSIVPRDTENCRSTPPEAHWPPGLASSSAIVRAAPVTVPTPRVLAADPETV